MNIGDLVQVAQHPDKWFRIEALDEQGNITKLEDVTTAVEKSLRQYRSQRPKAQRAAERAMMRLNA